MFPYRIFLSANQRSPLFCGVGGAGKAIRKVSVGKNGSLADSAKPFSSGEKLSNIFTLRVFGNEKIFLNICNKSIFLFWHASCFISSVSTGSS